MRSRVLTTLLLAMILAFAAYLRMTGQNWDDFSYSHPDERFLTALLLPAVGGANEYTNDDTNFPRQRLLVGDGEDRFSSAGEIAMGSDLRIAAVRDSFSSEVARWIAPDNQRIESEDNWAAVNALQTGQADIVVVNDSERHSRARVSGCWMCSIRDNCNRCAARTCIPKAMAAAAISMLAVRP